MRHFRPSVEPRDLTPPDTRRMTHIVERVLALDPHAADRELANVLENFEGRHRRLLAAFETRADAVEVVHSLHSPLTQVQRQLIGACFLHEYSFEAAALFNPSIVAYPDRPALPSGVRPIIISLRAVGEGHVSSLTFRSGVVAADGTVTVDPAARLASIPHLQRRVAGTHRDAIEVIFEPEGDISERVIFPVTEAQSNGIEDARFVEFDDGTRKIHYATYTAYNGRAIRSELLETSDFERFTMTPLTGTAARNKGMALFPRRIDGRYAMIGRQDNENLYLIYSDDLYSWDEGVELLEPRFPWEFVQIGNCGSPIELDDGWLLLTHGVGPMRRYCIGAALLDKRDPSRVLGRLPEPLLHPEGSAREGYVPNVVYTCGAMRLNDLIILPYAVSDTHSTFATIEIAKLLRAMVP
ncbi:MAG TPA: glycoside hydrolase family 130 protein [Steroidobacteraceae bacterium]